MAGGIGSRFWPMSRSAHPKQFIDILGTGESLLQQTFKRLSRICPDQNILIVTNEQYADLVAEQLPSLNKDQILTEPARRNTAPCIAYACFKIHKENPKASVIVAPSDHLITDETRFVEEVLETMEAAEESKALFTLGIKPNRPDTGYGYIQYIEKPLEGGKLFPVKTFTEKPNKELAEQFIESGDFLWNSGIFIWSTQAILESFKKHMPELFSTFSGIQPSLGTEKEKDAILKVYPSCKNISIDYGIMEKAEEVYVRPSDWGWSDLGTWGSLYEHQELDPQDNAVQGKNVLLYDCHRNMIKISGDSLVVLQGVSDSIVVEKDGVIMVCRKEDEQTIKQIVNDVKIEKGNGYV